MTDQRPVEQKNLTKPKDTMPTNARRDALEYQRDRERQMVRGVFRYYEVPGGRFEFNFKKYKGDRVEKYSFYDGEVTSVPLAVAKHLNNDCWYPEYGYVKGDPQLLGRHYTDGMMMKMVNKIRRVGFQSLEFMDVEDIGVAKEIIRVETAAQGV